MHLVGDLAYGLIWFAAGFICGADSVMAKARRMVRTMRTVSEPQKDWEKLIAEYRITLARYERIEAAESEAREKAA